MQLAQKISVSLDSVNLNFLDRYATTHAAKGRSAVIAKALQLLQKIEQEDILHAAYAASAQQDVAMAAQFDATLSDGLSTMPPRPRTLDASHETW